MRVSFPSCSSPGPLPFLAIFYDWIFACWPTWQGVHPSGDMWLSGSRLSTFTAERLELMNVMIIDGSPAGLSKMTWQDVPYLGA